MTGRRPQVTTGTIPLEIGRSSGLVTGMAQGAKRLGLGIIASLLAGFARVLSKGLVSGRAQAKRMEDPRLAQQHDLVKCRNLVL